MHNVMNLSELDVHSLRVYLFVSTAFFIFSCSVFSFIHCRSFWNLFVDFTDLSISMCLGWMHWCMHAYIIKLFKSFTHSVVVICIFFCDPGVGVILKVDALRFPPEAFLLFTCIYAYILKMRQKFWCLRSYPVICQDKFIYALPWISNVNVQSTHHDEWTLNFKMRPEREKKKYNNNKQRNGTNASKKVMIIREMQNKKDNNWS